MTEPYFPDRGDIIWLVMDPRVGHEQSGRRPVIVLSPKLLSERTQLAIVCPITSKIKGLPYEILLHGTKTKGAILPIHLRSVDVIAWHAKFIEKAPGKIVTQLAETVQTLISANS